MKATAAGVLIGAFSKESGVNIETIRYYERISIMPAPTRTAAGYRLYAPDHLKRLRFIRRARELGFSLEEVRGLLRLVDGQAYSCAEVETMTLEHLAEIRSKIADLRRLERVMATIAAQCTGDQAPECPVIDALFEARPAPAGRRPIRHGPSGARSA